MSWVLGLALLSLGFATLVILHQRRELTRTRTALAIVSAIISPIATVACAKAAASSSGERSDERWQELLSGDVAGHG